MSMDITTSGIWRYAELIGAPEAEHRISIGEGGTKLVPLPNIAREFGFTNLWAKLENQQAADSYKARYGVSAASHARAKGVSLIPGTSSGNAGIALATACRVAGITCRLAIVETAPADKLRMLTALGAEIILVERFGLDPGISKTVFDAVEAAASKGCIGVSSYTKNPAAMNGVKTIAFELAAQWGDEPADHVLMSTGAGGAALAITRGFDQIVGSSIERSPAVHVVQPEGNDTMASALSNETDPRDVTCTSKVSGLQVPNCMDARWVIHEIPRTGGTGFVVSDEEIYAAQKLLLQDGVFAEAASAASLAAAIRYKKVLGADKKIVLVITGSGRNDINEAHWGQTDQQYTRCPVDEIHDRMSA